MKKIHEFTYKLFISTFIFAILAVVVDSFV